MKTCIKCNRELSIDQFSIRADRPPRRRSACRDCSARHDKEYKAEHKEDRRVQNAEYQKAYDISRNYNLTQTQYKELIANGCAVCKTKENLNIDHDHRCCSGSKTCGKCIRGVLCRNHNHALGNTHDSVDELMALVAYLMKFEGSECNVAS